MTFKHFFFDCHANDLSAIEAATTISLQKINVSNLFSYQRHVHRFKLFIAFRTQLPLFISMTLVSMRAKKNRKKLQIQMLNCEKSDLFSIYGFSNKALLLSRLFILLTYSHCTLEDEKFYIKMMHKFHLDC